MAVIPIVPEYIRVHLGSPDSSAQNVTIPFPDYIKNVASSEIFSTWPREAIVANVLAQISFAMNRVYTEWYPSRGYGFDITNSTAYDQSYTNEGSVYENISEIVDDIFNNYLRKKGTVNPLFTAYCDGVKVQCDGLSQWGTVPLAQRGLSSMEILRYYYGDDTELVTDAPISENVPSYPGVPLKRGDLNENVRRLQLYLNRISRNYPAIPKIPLTAGRFTKETEDAVKSFQKIFKLTSDGIVGKSTWYKIIYIYDAVTRLAELSAEGVGYENLPKQFKGALKVGSRGGDVVTLQYFLNLLSSFVDFLSPIPNDGVYGEGTKAQVLAFQKYKNLPATGEVDEKTWNSLYAAFEGASNYLREKGGLGDTAESYPGVILRRGDKGPSVAKAKEYLSYIGKFFYDLPSLSRDNIFDLGTERSVSEFQRIFSLPISGRIDKATWDTIGDVYSVIRQGEKRLSGQYPGYELLLE